MSSIRKVKVLQGRAKVEADKQGLSPDDLVIVTTTIKQGSPPEYHLEKIEGDPVSFLLKRAKEGSEKVGGLEDKARTLADLQSKVYWLHQDGKWDFDTEKEAEDYLKGFKRQYISLEDVQQIQKLEGQKIAYEIGQLELLAKIAELEARLGQARQLVKEKPEYSIGHAPYSECVTINAEDFYKFLKWLEKLLGVLGEKNKTDQKEAMA